MIYVVASIHVKKGRLQDYIKVFKSIVPKVREERGCIQYLPTVDINADLSKQTLDDNVMTLIENWDSLDALHDHLATPHMSTYREKVKDIVEKTTIKVLQEA
jgi:quinol monooxygenase YgiN